MARVQVQARAQQAQAYQYLQSQHRRRERQICRLSKLSAATTRHGFARAAHCGRRCRHQGAQMERAGHLVQEGLQEEEAETSAFEACLAPSKARPH